MPAIFPFRALRYYQKKIPSLNRVVTPPYDVISAQEQEAFYKRSTYNFIRIVYGKTRPTDKPGQDRYSRAQELFHDWIKEGILRTDPKPAIYPYRQRFHEKGRDFDRWGLLALIRLGDATIFPHENTYPGPKQDRLQLIKAVQANLSPIFGLVDDRDHGYRKLFAPMEKQEPLMAVEHGGVHHDVWRITQPRMIQRFQAAIETKALLIADGHHRYEVAVQYRDGLKNSSVQFNRSHPANFMLIDVAGFDAEDPGILPTHRVFGGLDSLRFDNLKQLSKTGLSVTSVADEASMLREISEQSSRGGLVLGCYGGKGRYAVVSQQAPTPEIQLDVELLHRRIVPQHLAKAPQEQEQLRIAYTHAWPQAVGWVDKGEGSLAWYTQPPTFDQIIQYIRTGKRMPQKSTYFVPKPLAGLVVHRLRPAGSPPRGTNRVSCETSACLMES